MKTRGPSAGWIGQRKAQSAKWICLHVIARAYYTCRPMFSMWLVEAHANSPSYAIFLPLFLLFASAANPLQVQVQTQFKTKPNKKKVQKSFRISEKQKGIVENLTKKYCKDSCSLQEISGGWIHVQLHSCSYQEINNPIHVCKGTVSVCTWLS